MEKKGLGIQDLPEGTLSTIIDAVTSEMPADAIIIFGSYASQVRGHRGVRHRHPGSH